eukprot:jgi/Galph1/5651/GphlegSOOS_G4224.1
MLSILLELNHPLETWYVSEWLLSLGATSVEVCDVAVHTQDFSAAIGEAKNLARQKFRVLLPADITVEQFMMCLADIAEWKEVRLLEKKTVDSQDWIGAMKRSFQPIIVDDVGIYAPWHYETRNARIPVIIHPGMGFGTGEHPTTKLCLRWLQKVVKGGDKLLDYGSGSGILCITGSKLGCSLCHGVEIDEDSIRNAEENKQLNNTGNVVYFKPEEHSLMLYDIIVANILYHPLIDLAPLFASCAHLNTYIGLSGILYDQAEKLKQGFETYGFLFHDIVMEEQWCLLIGKKVKE